MNLNSFQPRDSTETMESLPFAMNGTRKSGVAIASMPKSHGNATNMGIGGIQNEQLTGRLDKRKV